MVKDNKGSKEQKSSSFRERAAEWIQERTWQDWTLTLVLIILLIIYSIHISQYKHVPGPVFGGDLYRDRGFVKNIVEGNPVWSDGFYVDEIQYYPYLVFAIEASIVDVTHMNLDKVFLFFPVLIILASAAVWYLLGRALFKNKTWGLLVGILFLATYASIEPKSATIGSIFFIPLFLYAWLRYEQTGTLGYAIATGITLGTLSLVHGSKFIVGVSMFAMTVVFMFIVDIIREKDVKVVKEYFLKYYHIALIAIAISLIFFLPLYLRYGLHSVNNVTQWGDIRTELLGLPWVFQQLMNMFFNTFSLSIFVFSIIALCGLLAVLFMKKEKEHLWLIGIFFSNVIVVLHPLLTMPLFHTSFLPEKLLYFNYFNAFFFCLGMITVAQLTKKFLDRRILIGIVVVLLLLPIFVYRFNYMKENKWDAYGMQDDPYLASLTGLADYITANVAKDQAILSNDESGFMLAVLSGRKVMLTRRTHASYYVDIDLRIAEASAAMYANDSTLAKEVLKKYNVKYFYIDQNLVQYPMRVRTDLKGYLEQHHVQFQEVYDRYDIAVPPEQANMMNLLIIPPQPLSQAFMELWEPVYEVQVQGQTVGQLFRLKE